MGDDDLVLVTNHRRVDAALGARLGNRHTPERLARASVDGEQRAVPARRVKHALALPEVQIRIGECVVLGPVPGRALPHQLARFFVERVKAVSRRPVSAPGAGDAARDDQVPVDHRRGRARVRKGQPAKLLHHRSLPEQLAVRREAHQQALRALHVHIARLGVYCGRRVRVPQIDDVAQEIILPMVPEHFARFRVEARHDFLQVGPFAQVTVDV